MWCPVCRQMKRETFRDHAVLALSDMLGLVHFGLLAGFAFCWALLADFLFAPALLLLLHPLGPERENVNPAP